MSAQPDRTPLMRAVAEVVVAEEKARAAADSDLTQQLKALRERVEELGAKRDDAPVTLPDELAEQLRNADRLIREWPPLRTAPPVRHVAGAMVTREGQLAVSYSDGTSERIGSVIGPQGAMGERGERGLDGIGVKGDEGPPGRDGVSVIAAAINSNDELELTLSDGTVLKLGRVVGRKKRVRA